MKLLHTLKRFITLVSVFHVISSCTEQTKDADVIVYGGTSSAVIAAVECAKSGKSVIVVSPDKHLGGLTSGGLGYSDIANRSTLGGLTYEFYHRIYKHYQNEEAWRWQHRSEYGNKGIGTTGLNNDKPIMWIFEPHVAEKVFEDFIKENNIVVYRREWLDREDGLKLKNRKIISFSTLSGKSFKGKVYIDATYEGDLMAAAGVSYRVGREACTEYNESWNGVQSDGKHYSHYFNARVDPFKVQGKPESGLLFGISSDPIAPDCTSDKKIQAYCFRMCMTNNPDNRIPLIKPANYDPAKYELLIRVFDSGWREWFRRFNPIPNLKTDNNNHGPFSTDYIGMNYDYPEASYERRREIIGEHEDYQKGLFYFVSNDERVPVEIRIEMQNWGLAADEFGDNNNWPYQLYIRETRRMVGEYVTTENDVLSRNEVIHPVGLGSYSMDSHNVQRYITSEGFVQNEGDVIIHPPAPYPISYGSIVPKAEECMNILVPVCISASHIAYGSVRMESMFMILGQSAAVAACIAIENDLPVQKVPYEELKKQLIRKGQIISFQDK